MSMCLDVSKIAEGGWVSIISDYIFNLCEREREGVGTEMIDVRRSTLCIYEVSAEPDCIS